MGVPAFFRWLSKKYPSIIVHCIEENKKSVDGVIIPNDSSLPNPNEVEFDNLYLDMNGIIHPCCHPENKPAPKNEDEMMVAIFEYIDRIFNIVRPRKVLYMAIDGVAPRAKMNQQRSRRFRASKESVEKAEEMDRIRNELEIKGVTLPAPKPKGEHFDSNCITPGTPFMARLADCLHYYIHDRLNHDPGWKDIKVILSDANGPGEGEHKIMDYIRRQRASPNHDPNTHHCLCGADADLIMLGLATHELNFTIIREEFKPNQPRPCELCAQVGHTMKECQGLAKDPQGENDELPPIVASDTEFIFIRLCVLREYLEKELIMHGLPFDYDFERALDDWVFMCFFVGNDFLPHLPSLEIREGAIDRLIRLYKDTVYKTGGYLTDSGHVNMARVQMILTNLGDAEDEIFKRRQENELRFRRRKKEEKKRARLMADKPAWTPGGQFRPMKPDVSFAVQNPRQEAYKMRKEGDAYHNAMVQSNNKDAAKELWAELKKGKGGGDSSTNQSPLGTKRKAETQKPNDSDSEEEPVDEVRLWEEGWKERYYASKFEIDGDTSEFRHKVARAYAEGLCWVLRYYYQGCASWKWFFPYHYAPFASDFVGLAEMNIEFERNTKPFNPMEQLMSVFPAASKQHLPDPWATLMDDPDSPIIDFYPDDFKIDLNGKKYAWQGVALLPFVDEQRLLRTLKDYYPMLTEDEKQRNMLGKDMIYVRKGHSAFDFFVGLYEGNQIEQSVDLDPSLTQGVSGTLLVSPKAIMPSKTVVSPVPGLDNIDGNQCICVKFVDPYFPDTFTFPAKVLPGSKEPARVLKPGDFESRNNRPWVPRTGFNPNRQRGSLDGSAHRHLNHNMRRQDGYDNRPQFGQNYRDQSPYGADRSWGQNTNRHQPHSHPYQRGRNDGYNQPNYQRNDNRGYNQGGGSRNQPHSSSQYGAQRRPYDRRDDRNQHGGYQNQGYQNQYRQNPYNRR